LLPVKMVEEEVLGIEEAGSPPAEDHAKAGRVLAREIEPGLFDRLASGREPHPVRPRHPALFGRREEAVRDLAHLGRGLRPVGDGVEERYRPDSALAREKIRPELRGVSPDGGDRADTRHNDTPVLDHPMDIRADCRTYGEVNSPQSTEVADFTVDCRLSTVDSYIIPSMPDRVDWHTYFMNIAHQVATRATCPRKHVGAVIARDRTILSTGYNGSVRGLPHCEDVGCVMEDGHCVWTVHAEANAIIQAAKNGVSVT